MSDTKVPGTLEGSSYVTWETAYHKRVEELADMTAERDRLRKFADILLMNYWPTGDVDGGGLQDAAVECGLLIATHPTEPCEEGYCSCLEYFGLEEFAEGGVTCYRREKP